jgi:hypothetical protein
MKDINGIKIKIGDTVKTQQPSGGILPPAPAETGEVCWYEKQNETKELAVRFKKENEVFYRYILLSGKINIVL